MLPGMWGRTFIYILLTAIAIGPFGYAQENINYNQINTDLMIGYTFKSRLQYFGEVGIRTLVERESGWSSLEVNNDLHYNIVAPVDLIAGMHLNYTRQTDSTDLFNNLELRPWLGARLHLTPNAKFMLSNLLRYEQRFMYYLVADDRQIGSRLRNRFELTWSINRPNFYHDKLWYITLDAEYFWPLNENPEERFANQAQVRLGIGYRLSYRWRFMVRFIEQFSRNTIDEDFKSSNLIFNFRVHFFIPAGTN
jgi:hypothetical protein